LHPSIIMSKKSSKKSARKPVKKAAAKSAGKAAKKGVKKVSKAARKPARKPMAKKTAPKKPMAVKPKPKVKVKAKKPAAAKPVAKKPVSKPAAMPVAKPVKKPAPSPAAAAAAVPAAHAMAAHAGGGWDFLDISEDGDDLGVSDAKATWFGGADDPDDNGETASGLNTKDEPDYLGCALPMDGFHHPSTDGSPIPRQPWYTRVQVTNVDTGDTLTVKLIDLGPSKNTRAGLDLTQPAFTALGGDLDEGHFQVDYRITGGALH
jgi:hypothetical protein